MFHGVTFTYWRVVLILFVSLCCWDIDIVEDKLDLILLSQIQYRMYFCTFLCGWIRKAPPWWLQPVWKTATSPAGAWTRWRKMAYLWTMSSASVYFCKMREIWFSGPCASSSRTTIPASMPTQTSAPQRWFRATTYRYLRLVYCVIWAVFFSYLIFNGVTGPKPVCMTAPVSSNYL